jgi:hypothetical protein
MMRFFSAHVRNGRLVLDEPIALHEGAFLELVSTDDILANGGDLLDAEERAALDRELAASIDDADAGEMIDWDDAITELRGSTRWRN